MWSKKCIFLKHTELQNLVLEKIENTSWFFRAEWFNLSPTLTKKGQKHGPISRKSLLLKIYKRSRFWHPNQSILFLHLTVLLHGFQNFWNPNLE